MKTGIGLSLGLAASLLASSASAQEVSATATPTSKLSVGAQMDLMLGGTGVVKGGGVDIEDDLETGYGIGANLDYAISPFISVGLAPRLILNVMPADVPDGLDADPGKELDLRVRLKGQYPVAPNLSVYGYLAPGYSKLMLDIDGLDDPSGFVLGGAVGATFDISPTLFASGEIGYQKGFQTTSAGNEDVDYAASYFNVGLGLGTRF